MAWNKPGDNGSKDPWGRKNEQGPPDLEELVKKMQDKLANLFSGGGGNGNDSEGFSWSFLGFIVIVFLMIWSLFGIYTVQPAEQGVVTRFGRFDRITQDGLNWHLPSPIERVQKVNVEQVRAVNHKALMLTKDENIVEIELVIQYRVINIKEYLFKVSDPDNTLLQATESALREIVGTSKMDAVLTSERERVALETKDLIQDIIDRYQTGLKVSSVNMQNAQPPTAVQAAFADVIKAREDQVRSQNKAQAYKNEVIENARGVADRLRQEAQAYKAQVTAHAEGETKRFLSILTEYQRAPSITRQRLYFESMESVLSNTSKVMVDVQSGNNLLVLPLNQLLGPTTTPLTRRPNLNSTGPTVINPIPKPDTEQGSDPRSRGGR